MPPKEGCMLQKDENNLQNISSMTQEPEEVKENKQNKSLQSKVGALTVIIEIYFKRCVKK